jgi:hypothetical protein
MEVLFLMVLALFPWSVFAASLVWLIRRELRGKDNEWRKFRGHGKVHPSKHAPVDVIDSAELIQELRKRQWRPFKKYWQ